MLGTQKAPQLPSGIKAGKSRGGGGGGVCVGGGGGKCVIGDVIGDKQIMLLMGPPPGKGRGFWGSLRAR